MDKQIAALEISNRYYELVIGYVLDDKVDILYRVKHQLSVPFKDGDIFDLGSLADDLSKINNIEINTANHKLNITIKEVVLVLPSYGLEVYRTEKTTNTVSAVSKVGKIDISNALALVKKERLPNINNTLVDIVPNRFILSNNKQYLRPPLNEESQNITIDANVYTLPGKMVKDMKTVCEKAGFKVKREVISPLGICNLLSGTRFKYDTYLLIDFSNKTTTLSFIGKNTLYSSNFFSVGIDDLIEKYMNEFQIDREKATTIKDVYGLDLRKTEYNPPIIDVVGSDGVRRRFNKDDITTKTLEFLKGWLGLFNGSFRTIMDSYQKLMPNIPLVFVGEGSRLNGFKDYILKSYSSNPIEIYTAPTVGCRDSEYVGCLGAIYLSSTYRGALEDENKMQVGELNRIADSNDQKEKVKEKYNELRDEL